MMMDNELLLSDEQDISQVAGTYVSTNTIDLGTAGTIPGLGGTPIADVGRGTPPVLSIIINEAVTSGGAAEVDFQLIQSANADLSSPTVVCATGAIAKATLVSGYRARLAIPKGISARYLGVQYVISTNTTTAGTVTAALVWDAGDNYSIA